MADIQELEAIVLRKTTYSDSSLIIATLTREAGQQHFLLKGALRQNKRAFPAADLFRQVEIQYVPGRDSDLNFAREIELIDDYDSIAGFPRQYAAAVWLSKFILQNTVADPVTQMFQALETVLLRLSEKRLKNRLPVVIGFLFSTLDEHGLLPEIANEEKQEQLDYMLAYATDEEIEAPDYDDEKWQSLLNWVLNFSEKQGLVIPEGLKNL